MEWFLILIACGEVPRFCVDCINREIARRTMEACGRVVSDQPTEGPRSSKRSLAASRGEEVPPVQGVQHFSSRGKQLRQEAKRCEKELREHDSNWWREDCVAGRPSFTVCLP